MALARKAGSLPKQASLKTRFTHVKARLLSHVCGGMSQPTGAAQGLALIGVNLGTRLGDALQGLRLGVEDETSPKHVQFGF